MSTRNCYGLRTFTWIVVFRIVHRRSIIFFKCLFFTTFLSKFQKQNDRQCKCNWTMGTKILPRPRPYKNLIVWWSHTRVSLEPWERIPSSFSLVWALVGDWSRESCFGLCWLPQATRPCQWWRLSALRYEVLEIATTGGLNSSQKQNGRHQTRGWSSGWLKSSRK